MAFRQPPAPATQDRFYHAIADMVERGDVPQRSTLTREERMQQALDRYHADAEAAFEKRQQALREAAERLARMR